MGYELHIVRRNNWDDIEEQSNITFAEWIAYVKTDEELELTNGYELTMNGESHSQSVPGFCEWTAHSTEKSPGYRPWFDYGFGSISTKNPDFEVLHKMLAIAKALQARVQGDDGEFYDEETVATLEASEAEKPSSPAKKPWWKFW
jgi:hypothetical protein